MNKITLNLNYLFYLIKKLSEADNYLILPSAINVIVPTTLALRYAIIYIANTLASNKNFSVLYVESVLRRKQIWNLTSQCIPERKGLV